MDQSRLGKRIGRCEEQGFDLGIQAYRASFPARSLTGKAHSTQVEIGNDLLGSGNSVGIDSLVGTGSPFGRAAVIDSS